MIEFESYTELFSKPNIIARKQEVKPVYCFHFLR